MFPDRPGALLECPRNFAERRSVLESLRAKPGGAVWRPSDGMSGAVRSQPGAVRSPPDRLELSGSARELSGAIPGLLDPPGIVREPSGSCPGRSGAILIYSKTLFEHILPYLHKSKPGQPASLGREGQPSTLETIQSKLPETVYTTFPMVCFVFRTASSTLLDLHMI